MNEGVFINTNNIDITLSQKEQYKICSFSGKSALNEQLIWGHYANAGMGVAIEVEVNNCSDIEQVTYADSFDQLNSIKEILTHKTKEWSYKNEFRHISENCCDRALKDRITKIYFGTPYEKLSNYEDIKENHTKLKKYLELKQELKTFCEK